MINHLLYDTYAYSPIYNNQYSYISDPSIASSYQYPNMNKDVSLRKEVTRSFYKKILKKIGGDSNKIKKLNKKKLYKLLRNYANKYDINWYDLHRVKKAVIKYVLKKLD